jgi:hypothetical protein
LIYIGVTGVPSGLRPALGGEGRRENAQTESKTCRLLAELALSAVRKNPQEPAQTRGSRQKKANPEGLVFPLLVEAASIEFGLKSLTGAKFLLFSFQRYRQYYRRFHVGKNNLPYRPVKVFSKRYFIGQI